LLEVAMFKKLLGTLLFVVAASFSATSWAQVIGYVHEVKGDVTLRATPSGQPTKAAAGDTFQQGAGVTTGADGNVTLKFEDGQLAVLAPNSQFVATTYVFNKTRVADSNIVFNLARGGLRFVSGVIAATNSSKFAVRTPTATAGVRGTDGTVMFADGVTIATTASGNLVLSVTLPGQTQPTIVTIPPGTTSVAAPGVAPTAAAPTASVPVPPALTALAVTIRAIAAAPVATTNTPVNPTATANAVRAAVALAVAVATGATPAQVAALQAAANTANATATTANNVTAAQAAAAGAVQAPPPATPVAPPPGQAPGTPPPVVTPPPAPPVTITVPSGS